ANGQPCSSASGCQSGVCTGATCAPCTTPASCLPNNCVAGACVAPTCSDGVQDGTETGVDCGGPSCSACQNGMGCRLDSDCASKICMSNVCVAGCIGSVTSGCGTGGTLAWTSVIAHAWNPVETPNSSWGLAGMAAGPLGHVAVSTNESGNCDNG